MDDAQADETPVDDLPLDEPPVERDGRAQRISKHPWWTLLVGLATIVGASFTVIAVFTDWFDDDSGSAGRAPEASATPAPSQDGAEPQVETGGPPGVDTAEPPPCLSGNSATACDQPHDRETFASPECTVDAAVRYFGGIPVNDHLLPTIAVSPFGDGNCVVDLPEESSTSMSGAFDDRTGDGLRWCVLDADLLEPVPCDEPHFGEVTHAGEPGTTEERDCLSSVEDYLGISLRDARGLVAREATLAGRSTCLVAVTGTQVLTSSVRDIVGRAVPFG